MSHPAKSSLEHYSGILKDDLKEKISVGGAFNDTSFPRN